MSIKQAPQNAFTGYTTLIMAVAAAVVLVAGALMATFLYANPVPDTDTVYVPSSDIPAYHIINSSNFADQTVKKSLLPNSTILKAGDLASGDTYYTTVGLSNGSPVLSSSVRKLMPGDLSPDDTAVVSAVMPGDIVAGLGVCAGDTVYITAWDKDNKLLCQFNDTYVMDVKPSGNGGNSVLVLAMSGDEAKKFIGGGSAESYGIARKAIR